MGRGKLHHIWNGEPLGDKRVLVCCHHGLGDTIHFVRFAAPLRRVAREVIFQTQPELLPVIAKVPGVDHVIALTERPRPASFDIALEVMELPHALRVDARQIRAQHFPYLPAAPRPPRSRSEIAVGLVWNAGAWAPQRSLPGALLAPLARVPKVRLMSFQRGSAATEACEIPARDVSSGDVEQTMKRLRELDLLITIDSFPAHLAGALGVPVWLLLQQRCDWRWMKEQTTSIWYPSMTLFRQQRQGDWQSVIDAVARELGAKSIADDRVA